LLDYLSSLECAMKQLLILPLLLVNIKPIGACECLKGPIEQHVRHTPYLVIGRVLQVVPSRVLQASHLPPGLLLDTSSTKYIATLLVEKSLKGNPSASDTILLSTSFSSCALSFERNSRYVLFLHEEKGWLTPTECSYSSKLYDEIWSQNLLKRIYRAIK
jgi:hypothetical protein